MDWLAMFLTILCFGLIVWVGRLVDENKSLRLKLKWETQRYDDLWNEMQALNRNVDT